MQGVTFKEIKMLNKYGYRIIDDDQECASYEKGEIKEENKILEIFPFNEMGKIRIHFVKDDTAVLAEWVQLQPKREKKGIILVYENNNKMYGKEIVAK